MSKRKIHKPRKRLDKKTTKPASVDSLSQSDLEQMHKRERYFDLFILAALLAFGIYQSAIYFGHKIVPISDFPDIVRIGHELLSFQLPSRFMQAPVVGLLQASLSYLVGGNHPDLTAGWLLNAILHPLNLVLFYLVGREIVGRAALWFAVIAILNYWVIYMLTEPIIETSLIFFVLLTFYLIFRHTGWCYVAASVATMVRYEGAALIMAAFVMDMIYRKSRKERIRAFVYSALATIPLAVWLLGIILKWDPEKGNYLSVFTKDYATAFTESVEERTGIIMHMRLLWEVGFQPLFVARGAESARILFGFSKIIAAAGFFFGVVYGLFKRRWKILALLIFFVPYFLLHARYPYPLQRFHTTIFWIALLICLFGLQSIWKLIDKNQRVPRFIVIFLQAILAIVSVIWLISLVPDMTRRTSAVSPTSAYLPWIAIILAGVIFAGRIYIYKPRQWMREICILAFFSLIIVSNQFALVGLVGDGQRDKEFKQLADWYIANAKPGEKMGVYMHQVVGIYAQKYANDIVALPQADSPEEFTKACYEEGLTYVVWATREGLRDYSVRYRRLGLDKNMARLSKPRTVPPYQFVAQVGWEGGYVNIFRLQRRNTVTKPGG
jgi:hypothetical protein